MPHPDPATGCCAWLVLQAPHGSLPAMPAEVDVAGVLGQSDLLSFNALLRQRFHLDAL